MHHIQKYDRDKSNVKLIYLSGSYFPQCISNNTDTLTHLSVFHWYQAKDALFEMHYGICICVFRSKRKKDHLYLYKKTLERCGRPEAGKDKSN
jgi:hypothetical protein